MKRGLNGVSAKTPENILLGAGTFHIGLKYDVSKKSWNYDESCVGATKGGNGFEYVPELYEVEPDGAGVSIAGLTDIVGAEGTLTINGLEILKPELIKAAMIGESATSEDETMDKFVPKGLIEEGDYFKNVAYVGRVFKTKEPIIIIFDIALCTSGFKIDGQNKEANTAEYVFKCFADITSELDKLPIRIYRPKATA